MPRPLIVGASNVARDLRGCVGAALDALPSRPEALWIAAGRGRSYGGRAFYWLRGLPSILDSSVWARLAARGGPTHLLVTDIGNDLAYGHPPRRVARWVDTCLARADVGPRAIVVGLPLGSLDRLPAAWIELATRLLFPRTRLDGATLRARAEELDRRLAAVAAARGASFVTQRTTWYGVDPIHPRRAMRADAWSTLCAPWREDASESPEPRSRPGLRGIPLPDRYRLGPLRLGRPQPAARCGGVPIVLG